MESLTPEEKCRIKKAIRNNDPARKFYGTLNRHWKSRHNNPKDYPITSAVVRIYAGEMCNKFMKIADSEARKSSCARRKVGAVLEKEGETIGKGYNGVPYNLVECTSEAPCFKINNHIKSGSPVDEKYCRAMHAEELALINAAKRGMSTVGAVLYSTHQPCLGCALRLIAADIDEIYYENSYPDEFALKLLKKAGVKVHYVKRS